MKIPVFLSSPSSLNATQEEVRKMILRELDRVGLEPRAIGRSDYPTELPLREVLIISRHCAGGVILGFEQFQANSGILKRGTTEEKSISHSKPFPSAWNNLEAGIIYTLGLPLLVFAEQGISGGIFDHGVTDVFIHDMPKPTSLKNKKGALASVFQKWQAQVRSHYYS